MSHAESAHLAHLPNPRDKALGIAYGMGAGALWGLVLLAPKLTQGFNPMLLSVGRYLCYGTIAAILLAPRWRPVMAHISRRQWANLFGLSLVGNTLYYVLLSSSVRTSGIAMTSLVIGFLPVTITLIGSRDRNAVPLAKLMPSLLLCAGGAVCIGWQAFVAPAADPLGMRIAGLLYALCALAAWTAFAVGNARCLMKLKQVSAYDWNLLTGLVTGAQNLFLLPVALLVETAHHDVDGWLQLGAVAAGIAILASIVGNALWNRASRLLPLTLVGQMILFETLFAMLYGFLWEHRWPTLTEIAALAFVSTSVLTCLAVHRKPSTSASKTS